MQPGASWEESLRSARDECDTAAQAMSTAMDGIAYAMNVPAGSVTVNASKTGITFKAHAVNARPDKVTLTLVTP